MGQMTGADTGSLEQADPGLIAGLIPDASLPFRIAGI
jgi:hypothetical protein